MEKVFDRICIRIALSPIFLLMVDKDNIEYYTKVQASFKEEFSKSLFRTVLDGVEIPIKFKFITSNRYFEDNKDESSKKLYGDFIIADFNVDLNNYIQEQKQIISSSLKENDMYKGDLNVEDLVYKIFCDELKRIVLNIIISTNIVYPGYMEIIEGTISLNNSYYIKLDKMNSSLFGIHEEVLKKNWPKLEKVSLIETWDWLTNKVNYSLKVGNTPANRAMNAFSYQFNADNYEDLFYSLLGLEALYNTTTSEGIMKQISNKTSLLFGEPVKYKKSISQMYQVRSAFVHGALNFPDKFYRYDADTEFETFYFEKYSDALKTAQSLLIASLRLLIINNAVEFKTKISIIYD